jgi:hypothetical protein
MARSRLRTAAMRAVLAASLPASVSLLDWRVSHALLAPSRSSLQSNHLHQTCTYHASVIAGNVMLAPQGA